MKLRNKILGLGLMGLLLIPQPKAKADEIFLKTEYTSLNPKGYNEKIRVPVHMNKRQSGSVLERGINEIGVHQKFAGRKLWFEQEPYKDRELYKRKPLEIEEKKTPKLTGYMLIAYSLWSGYIGYNLLSGATKESKLAYIGSTFILTTSISSLIAGIKILKK